MVKTAAFTICSVFVALGVVLQPAAGGGTSDRCDTHGTYLEENLSARISLRLLGKIVAFQRNDELVVYHLGTGQRLSAAIRWP